MYVVNNHVDCKSPQALGLWEPFQMANFMAYKWGGDPNHFQVLGWSSEYSTLAKMTMCWLIGLTQVRNSFLFFGKACCCYGECPLMFNIFLSSPLEVSHGHLIPKMMVSKYGVSLSIYVKFWGCISTWLVFESHHLDIPWFLWKPGNMGIQRRGAGAVPVLEE